MKNDTNDVVQVDIRAYPQGYLFEACSDLGRITCDPEMLRTPPRVQFVDDPAKPRGRGRIDLATGDRIR